MADNKTDYLEVKVLDHVLGTSSFSSPTDVYVSLHTADPTDEGEDDNEVAGGSYSRKVMTFTGAATVGGLTTASNTSDIIWTNLPSATITHIAIWDASTSGNMLYHAELSAPKVIGSGDGYTISTGQLVVSEN